ncbi:hypothetical protein L1887_57662 [Cichorium endivia]|nr:hypothetical protein L1887_57662 [Cichorium endivia]
MSATAASGGNLGLRACRSTRTSPVDGGSEAGLREPEVALGIDGQKARIDLLPAVGEQFESVGDHAVIGQQRLLLDLGAQRHHAVAVNAALQRLGLDHVPFGKRLRKRRQAVGNGVFDVGAPQPHQPRQFLLGKTGLKSRLGDLTGQFGIKDLLAGLTFLVERTGFSKLDGKFRGGIRRGLRLRQLADIFPCRHGGNPGAADI